MSRGTNGRPGGTRSLKSGSTAALIEAMAAGLSLTKAAEAAGLSHPTAIKRLKDPETRQQLHERRRQVMQDASNALTAATTEAVERLLWLVRNATDQRVQMSCCRAILEFAPTYHGTVVQDELLAQLQAQVAAIAERTPGMESMTTMMEVTA